MFVEVFLWFPASWGLYESQATNRNEPERGGSRRESSLLPIGYLEVIYDFQLQGYGIFIAIWIRVKFERTMNSISPS
jgi:hypothetical protein